TLAPRMRPGLSRNTFAALLIVVSACAASARNVPGAEHATAALVSGFVQNKVLWICLGIAVWHLLRNSSPALGGSHLAAAVPAMILAASAAGIWPWIGLSLFLAMLLATPGWGPARTGLLIALVAALHEVAINVVGELGGDILLGIDAWIAATLASAFLPDLQVEGNALQMPGGHMVVLVWGCSSLTNLGDALLMFWALVSIGVSGSANRRQRRRFVGGIAIIACITIALNATRLTLMAGDHGTFHYLHTGEGAAWFRLATLGITVLMSRWLFRDEQGL
ncbi:MAG: hypothetical protein JSW48_12880, partial [Betaproteobacteria bacterium]